MESADNQPETPSSAAPPRRLGPAAWAGIALGSVVVIAVLAFFGLRATGVLKPPVPTPACVEPTLTLGTARYRIKPIARARDGSLPTAGDAPDMAYWVEDTNVNYVFALSPAPENLALNENLKPGDQATIVWANCNSSAYTVSEVTPGAVNDSGALDQSTSGITVVVRTGTAAGDLTVRAELVGETLKEIETPAAGVLAEISLGDTVLSPDGQEITIAATLQNTGPNAFTLHEQDVSLTVQGGQATKPIGADPPLPRKVGPGESATMQLTFARPTGNEATFRVFDAEFDVEVP